MLKPISPDAYKLFHEGTLALADIETNGMRIDVDYLRSTMEGIDAKSEKMARQLSRFDEYKTWKKKYGKKMKLDSREQLADIIFDEYKYEGKTYLPTGRVKADEEAFQDVDSDFVRLYIKRTKLQKLKGTYLRGIERELVNGRVHVSYGLHVAKTYRSNCYDFNAQNLPIRDPFMGEAIRKCFIPEEGHVIVEMDYGQLEVRIAACYHKDPTMISYLKDESKCMHRDTAAELFLCKKEQVSKDMRYCAKNMFVFPGFYGSWFAQCAPNIWAAMSRMDLHLQGEEAPSVREHLRSKGIKKLGTTPKEWGDGEEEGNWTPDKKSYFEHVKKVEDIFWKQRFVIYSKWKKSWYENYQKEGGFNFLTGFRATGYYSRNDVINHPVQGSAFHCLLWSLIQLNKRLRKNKMRSRIIGQIHDSIIASVHKKELKQYVSMAGQIMTEEIRDSWKWITVPLKYEAEATEVNQAWYYKKPLSL